MFSYTPKLHHALITAILCALCIGFAGTSRGSWSMAFKVLGTALGFMTVVIMVLLLMEGVNSMVQAQTDWMKAFGNLDDEGRAAVAFMFPKIRYRMKRGEVREFFEDTNVPMETFRLFLHLSNSKYISPRRDWFTEEKPQWAWLEIQEYLQENGYIVPDSAAGSHSWLWNGNAWNHLLAYWGAGLHVREMRDMNVFSTTPPQAEDVGSD